VTHYFLDSSALIKRYIPEQGTRWIRSITSPSANIIFISHITTIEIVSGLNRRVRAGYLSAHHAQAICRVLDNYVSQQYVGISLTHQVAARAKDLLENHPLRAYDSIQLASALESNAALITARLPALIFLCADKRLSGWRPTIQTITLDCEPSLTTLYVFPSCAGGCLVEGGTSSWTYLSSTEGASGSSTCTDSS